MLQSSRSCQPVLVHGACITISVALLTIGLLAHFDVLKSIGVANPWLPYALYGGAALFAIIEMIHIASICCQAKKDSTKISAENGDDSVTTVTTSKPRARKITPNRGREIPSHGPYNKGLPLTKLEYALLENPLSNAECEWAIKEVEKYIKQLPDEAVDWYRKVGYTPRVEPNFPCKDMVQYKKMVAQQVAERVKSLLGTNRDPLLLCKNLMRCNFSSVDSLIGQMIYIALIYVRNSRLRSKIDAGEWKWWQYDREML